MRYLPEQEVACSICERTRIFEMVRTDCGYTADPAMRRAGWSPHEDLCPACIRARREDEHE